MGFFNIIKKLKIQLNLDYISKFIILFGFLATIYIFIFLLFFNLIYSQFANLFFVILK